MSLAVFQGNLAGDGRFTRLCCEWMEREFGAPKVLLTHSCTAALEMAALLSDVGVGDEVIMPSYGFVSTANAFALRGASIRFVDIREDTLNLDERLLEDAVNGNTKVVVPVHYAGVSAEMDPITEIARRRGLQVVEDAAQGIGSTYRGQPLGTLGSLGTVSFHETKNIISGAGGALVVNDERLVERARVIGDKGTNRSEFFRGEVDKYTWVDLGSSFLASELTAAFLFAQFEQFDRIMRKREAIFDYYAQGLVGLENQGLIRLPVCPPDRSHNGHMFYILLRGADQRSSLIEHLRSLSIQAVFHYVPLHSSPMGLRVTSVTSRHLPVTEDVAARLLRLPCYYELEPSDQDRVIDGITDFFGC